MSPRHRPARILAAAPLLIIMASCGSEPADPQVASLPSSATTVTTDPGSDSSPDSDSGAEPTDNRSARTRERPVFRVDDTEERRKAIWNAYNACLLDNGATAPPSDGMGIALGDSLVDYASAPAQALQACAHLEPLQPPALEAATNPDFRDQSLAYVRCLQDGGLWVTLLNDDNIDWTYTEGHPVPDDSAQLEQDCLVEAFGGA